MRVLLCTLPQNTHFLTLAPLAWALRTAGHEVRVASAPGFSGRITQAGLTASPVGRDPEVAEDDSAARESIRRGLPRPYDVAELGPDAVAWDDEAVEGYGIMVQYAFGEDNEPMIDDLVELARAWQPDLVLWEPFTYAGPIAAKACGAVHARFLFTTDVLGVTHEWVRGLGVEDPLIDLLTEASRRYGLDYSDDLVAGQFTINQLPPSLRTIGTGDYLHMQYVPYGGPAVLPKWLWAKPERPRVALTMGLSATEYFDGYTFRPSDILASLADLDIEVVATVAASEQKRLGTVPDNCRIEPYVALHALAPTCSAVIHHGGFGTLSTVALHGVPHLVLPYHFEGPLLARKLAEQGAGLVVDADAVSGQAIREALLRLLHEPEFEVRAARLRAEYRSLPSPNELVPQIEQYVAKLR
ncbi:activator-dependent family glycosyltransferase [Actinoplanes sp. NEAU-A12]|uniref:Activator-dependent family glycosyltransferase n=1 Tax=Actinoplanes sandaracinus TaxID=3045177 RepID=A0ABT6X009_9ACTN|nr:activator-dependent family glycosyltransferase [Actinoplanes sandaracinus]MDI6105170.1 activator-dependent family glycosyltransferase [Actinoplanes sandaracinus]